VVQKVHLERIFTLQQHTNKNMSGEEGLVSGTESTFGKDIHLTTRDELRDPEFWRAAFAEFTGTCFFLIIGVGAALASATEFRTTAPDRLLAISAAFGIAITVLVYSYAHISGANFNPAVSLALVVAKRITPIRGFVYIITQTLGAVVGAYAIFVITPADRTGSVGAVSPDPDITTGEAFLLEFVFTTILLNVVFGTAVDIRATKQGTMHVGPAVGLCIFCLHLAGISLTGCGINPARAFGTAVASGNFDHQWLYWLAPLLAGVFVGGTYPWIWGQGKCCAAAQEARNRRDNANFSTNAGGDMPSFGEKH